MLTVPQPPHLTSQENHIILKRLDMALPRAKKNLIHFKLSTYNSLHVMSCRIRGCASTPKYNMNKFQLMFTSDANMYMMNAAR